MPYTAHWTPPPFCRVRLYRNMVSYFVARATRRTLNRLRLPLAPTSVARLAMISPWGLIGAQTINPRGFCRRQFFSTAKQSASGSTASEWANSPLCPADGIELTVELSPASRHCGCARTESAWLWATEPNRDASSHRVRGLQGSGQGARMRPRRGFSAMDRPRDRVSGIRVGGRLARRGDCWNGRVEKRVRDRLCGITGTVR